jgi:hypothetical protein
MLQIDQTKDRLLPVTLDQAKAARWFENDDGFWDEYDDDERHTIYEPSP